MVWPLVTFFTINVTVTRADPKAQLNGEEVGGTVVTGTAAQDSIRGTLRDDVLSGLSGDDWISGWDGNDLLIGGSGVDTLTGGAGEDVFDVSDNFDPHTKWDQVDQIKDFRPGEDKFRITGVTEVWYRYVNVLVADYNGPDETFFDGGTFIYDGNGGDARIFAYLPDFWSELTAAEFDGNVVVRRVDRSADMTLTGGSGNDYLYGANGSDTITGGEGDDILEGFGGRDVMTGGTGRDGFEIKDTAETRAIWLIALLILSSCQAVTTEITFISIMRFGMSGRSVLMSIMTVSWIRCCMTTHRATAASMPSLRIFPAG